MNRLIEIVSCGACGSGNLQHEMKVNGWQLVRCAECNLVFTSPRYSEAALAQIYADNYYERSGAYFESVLGEPSEDHRKLARAAARLRGGALRRSLDVGCGAGRLVAAFQDVGFHAAGIEPSRVAAEAGRREGRKIDEIALADVPGESFDCITAMHVLEHVPSPKEFLGHCWRILTQDGVVIIEVPNYGCKRSRQLRSRWKHLYPDTHLYQFTPTTLARVVRQAGFTVLRIRLLGGGGGLSPHEAESVVPTSRDVRGAPSLGGRGKQFIWRHRQMLFSVPYVKDAGRFLFWHVLGRGEYLRLFARKSTSA